MMKIFAIIYLLFMCCVVHVLHKYYDEFTEGIDSRKKRIMANVICILLAPVVWVIGGIELLKKNLKK